MAEIALQSVTKTYSDASPAVDDVTLTVADGEFLVLVGPSGCGKSTLLRVIAGLEQLDAGSVRIDGREMAGVPPQRRDVAMVFQNYALYPHMTVRENLGYGLKVAGVRKEEAGRRIDDVARLLGLEELLERKPGALSGGQRQRTAMGRAIVREPTAFLMDEPLSNLDAKLRVSMRASLAELHGRLATTTVYVTHDQIEAMTLGQRVAVMHEGRLQQVDTPRALYDAPANLVVASFIGSPPMNLVRARLGEDAVEFGTYRIPLASNERPTMEAARNIVLGMRPEDLSPTAAGEGAFGDADVILVEEHGADAHVVLALDAPGSHAAQDATADPDNELLGDGRARFVARVDARTRLRKGERVALAIDPARLHFFEGVTGRRLPKRSDVDVSAA